MVSESVTSKEFLDEQDKVSLDTMKLKLALAGSNAERALAQTDVAKLTYSNMLLQFAMKYSLSNQDAITEEGEIIRNVPEAQVATVK